LQIEAKPQHHGKCSREFGLKGLAYEMEKVHAELKS